MIMDGMYSFPFTLHLPDWLPQSVLCFNTPNPKKPNLLNTFKIRYNLIAVIEGTEEAAKAEVPSTDQDFGRDSSAAVRKSGPRRTIIVKTEK